MHHITALAHVRGRTPTLRQDRSRITDVMYLDAPIKPTAPIHIGARVRICLLTLNEEAMSQTSDEDDRAERAPKYYAETSNVSGMITRIRALEAGITEFIIENENRNSTTDYAYLAIPHVEGVTVALPLWLRAL